MLIQMRRQEIVLQASKYLLTRCEWFLQREEKSTFSLVLIRHKNLRFRQRNSLNLLFTYNWGSLFSYGNQPLYLETAAMLEE